MRANDHQPTSSHKLRKQVFVETRVQGQLLFRIMLYSVLSSLVTAGCYLSSNFMVEGASPWIVLAGPLVVALIVSTPLIMYDAAHCSNRLVGPIVRAQGIIRRLSKREVVQPMSIRDRDLWSEWIQDFNAMLNRLQANATSPSEKDSR